MAFEYTPDDQDQKNNNLNMDSQSSGGTTGGSNPGVNVSGSAAGSGGAGGTSTGGTNPNSQGTSSGRFTNITNYLNANQGYNAQGGGLGGQVASNLQNQYNQQQQGVQNAQNTFNTTAQADRVQYDPNSVNTALNDPYAYLYGQQYSAPASGSTAQTPGMNTNNYNQFENQLNAKYQGPTSLDNTGQLQAQAQNVNTLTGQTGTEQGRYALLRDMYSTPQYSGGQQNLDQLLLQSDPNQLAKIAATRSLGGQALSSEQQAENQAASQGQQYQQEAQNTANQTQQALGNAINQFGSTEAQNAASANAAAQTAYNNLINNHQISSQDVQALQNSGVDLSGLLGKDLYGQDLGSYFTQNPIQANAQNIASAADYAKIGALQKLAGNTQTGANGQILASFQDPTQAGAYAALPRFQANVPLLQQSVQKAAGAYNADYANLADQQRQAQQDMANSAAIRQMSDAQLSNPSDPVVAALLGGQGWANLANSLFGNKSANPQTIRDNADAANGRAFQQLQDIENKQHALNSQYGIGKDVLQET